VIVASQVVARGQLARIQLAAGTYAISGIFGEAFSNGQHLTGPRTFVVIPAGTTIRQDLTRAIP